MRAPGGTTMIYKRRAHGNLGPATGREICAAGVPPKPNARFRTSFQPDFATRSSIAIAGAITRLGRIPAASAEGSPG